IAYTRCLGVCSWSCPHDRGVLVHSAGPALRNMSQLDNHILAPLVEERHGHCARHEGQFERRFCTLRTDGERQRDQRQNAESSTDNFVHHFLLQSTGWHPILPIGVLWAAASAATKRAAFRVTLERFAQVLVGAPNRKKAPA